MKNIAALFTGQGAQRIGMGKSFFETSEIARDLFQVADKTLGFSLSKLCFEGPIEELTLTANAQPALLLTSYISFLESAVKPIAGAGHSLGEYSALVSAGAIKLEDALTLVHKRGIYMQEAVPAGSGKMVAVMGPEEEELRAIISLIDDGIVEIANLNTPGQTVISGAIKGIDAFLEVATEKKIKAIPLNVSAPFHCSLMKSAAEKLSADLDAVEFNVLNFKIYANFTAQVIQSGREARELLKRQVCGTVRWFESIRRMIAEQGITTTVEFGASDVLTKMQKRIDDNVEKIAICEASDLVKLT